MPTLSIPWSGQSSGCLSVTMTVTFPAGSVMFSLPIAGRAEGTAALFRPCSRLAPRPVVYLLWVVFDEKVASKTRTIAHVRIVPVVTPTHLHEALAPWAVPSSSRLSPPGSISLYYITPDVSIIFLKAESHRQPQHSISSVLPERGLVAVKNIIP